MDETKYGFWFPPDVSTHGVQIDQLIDIVHWFMLILFVGWGIFFVYCLIKYRARPGHAAAYLPPKAQFTKVIEGAVIVVEVLLLFGFSTPVWFKYKNHPPAEKDVIVQISSKDVIHSFNIPVLRVKQDAVPGARIPIWFKATQPGHFELACAQLCGLGHYRMRADVLIDTPEDYAKWQAENAPPAQEAPTSAAP